jgi:hypothetical protein
VSPPRLALIALASLLALTGCHGGERAEEGAEVLARPPLYEIANADSEVEGWLLGTIHALPDGTGWRTTQIDDAIGRADVLLVEVAELDQQQTIAATFQRLATTPGLGPLAQRVTPGLQRPLGEMLEHGRFAGTAFNDVEDWAAAIMLAQVDAYGSPRNGVDRALIGDFAGRKVVGFETATAQLGIFDRLAPDDQRALLEGTIAEWQAARKQPGRLTRAWLGGDIATLEAATTSGIMTDPQVRAALLVDRNSRWMPVLLGHLEARERPLVAVGTAHLIGPDGLIAMLEARGYTVTPRR